MFSHFWLFLQAVAVHTVTLAAGCVVTVLIGLLEKHVFKRTLTWKGDLAILLCFVFFACFQAWRDEYEKAAKVTATPPVQITNEVHVPPTNPPAINFIPPVPKPTAQVQFDDITVPYVPPSLVEGKEAMFSVYWHNVGDTSARDFQGGGKVYMIGPFANNDDGRKQEQQITKDFVKNTIPLIKTGPRVVLQKGGKDRTFFTVIGPVLSKDDMTSLANQTKRLYIVTAVFFKDSVGSHYIYRCGFLITPTTDPTYFHFCEDFNKEQ